jgi:uncharacterized iron-regulated membrane protein
MGADFQPFTFMVEAPGAFVCLGIILATMNALTVWIDRRAGLKIEKKRRRQILNTLRMPAADTRKRNRLPS